MHDLNTINRLNAEAVARAQAANPDKFLVVHKSGAHVVSSDVYDNADDALQAVAELRMDLPPGDSVHFKGP